MEYISQDFVLLWSFSLESILDGGLSRDDLSKNCGDYLVTWLISD